ncbi:MAG: hypothetical protein GXP31_17465 [Kiritimatiellaeota bacterium]|nr:hypothetical protein [Kiritimatiellota bacterium]
MKRVAALLLGATLTSALGAEALPRLPLDFNSDPGWKARPRFLGNPADRPEVVAANGSATLRVAEPGRGMKFELQVKPFDSDAVAYLLMRYKARNLAGGYALWIFDGSAGGRQILGVTELEQDGRWHVIAVDLWARGAVGLVRSLLTEVQCRDKPASIAFDYIRLSDELPVGARVVPKHRPPEAEQVVHAAALKLEAQPTWLGSPSKVYRAETRNGLAHLSAGGAGRGMKWSAVLPAPVDLSKYGFVAVRYRGRNVAPWGDYLVYLGSGPGGRPENHVSPIALRDVQATGEWQVAIAPVRERFTAANIALQVSSAGDTGEIWIDTIRFTARRPLIEAADMISFAKGWDASVLPPGAFSSVNLARDANVRIQARLRRFGLRSWLPEGDVTIHGIPFRLLGAGKNVVGEASDGAGRIVLPVGRRAAEMFFLMVSKLPDLPPRHGRIRPLTWFATPERFLVRVEYADGVRDDMFPICRGTAEFEVRAGPQVYALTGLRPNRVRRIVLWNRTDGGVFLLAGATVNQGPPVVSEPGVFELPAPIPVRNEQPGVARIVGTADGFRIGNALIEIDLKTRGGIELRRIDNRCLRGESFELGPGPLFEIGADGKLLTSAEVAVGTPSVSERDGRPALVVPVDGSPRGVPLKGELRVTVRADGGIEMRLALTQIGPRTCTPVVNFPVLRNARIGAVPDTWYLWARKGGLIHNAPIHQRLAYGGEHPLQVTDVFNPRAGGGLALMTLDLEDVYRFRSITKDDRGVTLRIEYWQREYGPGEAFESVPTVLRAHTGDWRRALALYKQWGHSWYRPAVPRKAWFQRVFYYQQTTAWGRLRDRDTGRWRMEDEIRGYRDYFGCLDYLHIFDFGQSRKYGRVGDYSHFDELGGLEAMRAAIRRAQDMGVRIGLYIEGYLCDERGVWGRENASKCDIRKKDGSPLLWPGAPTEHMMCPASLGWRRHLAATYKRVTAQLKPDGMYIDQYGFTNTWKTCWSREHGHPVPWPPIRGERDTTRAIRAATPSDIATLTEETPNDVNSQFQDGALGYSVWGADPGIAPHRVDLFRFAFPTFKVFQLTQYEAFTNGNWEKLKFPFFNGEGYWLGNSTAEYCEDAHRFLRRAFAVLHRYADVFCSENVEPLVPTEMPFVYANRFRGGKYTVWTLFNGRFRTVRGVVLRVPHRAGTKYLDAWRDRRIQVRVESDTALIPVELGPRAVGCVAAVGPE